MISFMPKFLTVAVFRSSALLKKNNAKENIIFPRRARGRGHPWPALPDLESFPKYRTMACIVVGWVQIKSPASMVDIEAGRQQGLVKWFNPTKGFGFIEQDNGQDLFVHQSEIKLSGFRYLNKDDRVEYDIGLGKKGPVAQNVVRIKEAENEWEQVPEEEPISRAS